MHPLTTRSRGLAVRDHPVKDAERLRETAPGRIGVPNFFFVASESPSLRF